VPEFLTPEWVAELDARAREAGGSPAASAGAGRPLTVELHVTGAPNGEFVFQAAFGDATVRYATGTPAEPDLVVTLDAGFAARIRSGDANAQDALAARALKVRGDLEQLARAAPALAALGEAFGTVFAEPAASPDA